MRHQKAHRKLGRTTAHRMSMLRNLATSLINSHEERLITTLPKAKELRPFVEKVITLSRNAQGLEGDEAVAKIVHLRRQAATYFHAGNSTNAQSSGKRGVPRAPRTAGVAAVKRLFDVLGTRYKDRPGGYTRILKLGRRAGDNAELAIIELVGNPREAESEKTASKKTKTAGAKKKAASPGGGASGRRGAAKSAGEKADEPKAKKGRGSKKTESTANEQDTEK
jgi:large subunit ribosomal protein L17